MTLNRRLRLTTLSLIFFMWDVKEPMTLFEKSRGRTCRTRCHGRSGHWSGVGEVKSYMDDVQSHLSGFSAIQPLAHSL